MIKQRDQRCAWPYSWGECRWHRHDDGWHSKHALNIGRMVFRYRFQMKFSNGYRTIVDGLIQSKGRRAAIQSTWKKWIMDRVSRRQCVPRLRALVSMSRLRLNKIDLIFQWKISDIQDMESEQNKKDDCLRHRYNDHFFNDLMKRISFASMKYKMRHNLKKIEPKRDHYNFK